MIEKQTSQIRKERFEFKLTVNDNIICQRYFKINNFNENSLHSLELKDTIDLCVALIDNDLKSKSRVYTWHTAPQIFNSEEEMNKWISNPSNANSIRFGESIFLRNSSREYWWNGEKAIECSDTINDGEFTSLDETPTMFKFSFLDNGNEVYSKVWSGEFYPKFVRNGVDLSNKRGKFEDDDITKLNFESSLLNHMVNDKTDLVSVIIKEICDTCTVNTKKWYTTNETYGKGKDSVTYDFSIENDWNKYVNNMAKFYKKKTDEYFKNL